MTDADQSTGENMEQESAQKLVGRDGCELLLATMGVISPEEGNMAIAKTHEAMVRDGHAMRVASQIVQHLIRPAEWRLGIDDPVLAEQLSKEPAEGLRVRYLLEGAVELELVAPV